MDAWAALKALAKFVELKKDLWSMHDSFETFVESTVKDRIGYPVILLSDELANAVQENSGKIVRTSIRTSLLP